MSFEHHGGQRKQADQCSNCHTPGAVDGASGLYQALGGGAPAATKGVSCATNGNSDCATNPVTGSPAGVWKCFTSYPGTPAPTGGAGASCYMMQDPTPGPPIYFSKAYGTMGPACFAATEATDCVGLNAGWEGCYPSVPSPTATNTPCAAGQSCNCYIIQDPKPGQPVDFRVWMHDIHFARLRDGYAESNNLIVSPFVQTDNIASPGLLEIGTSGGIDNYSEILFPQDIRNCTTCHASTNAPCSSTAPCGVGQTCTSPGVIGEATTGNCVNTSWKNPSAMVCTSCHDSQPAFAHVASMLAIRPTR